MLTEHMCRGFPVVDEFQVWLPLNIPMYSRVQFLIAAQIFGATRNPNDIAMCNSRGLRLSCGTPLPSNPGIRARASDRAKNPSRIAVTTRSRAVKGMIRPETVGTAADVRADLRVTEVVGFSQALGSRRSFELYLDQLVGLVAHVLTGMTSRLSPDHLPSFHLRLSGGAIWKGEFHARKPLRGMDMLAGCSCIGVFSPGPTFQRSTLT